MLKLLTIADMPLYKGTDDSSELRVPKWLVGVSYIYGTKITESTNSHMVKIRT